MAKYKWYKHRTLSLYRSLGHKPAESFYGLGTLSNTSATSDTVWVGQVASAGTALTVDMLNDAAEAIRESAMRVPYQMPVPAGMFNQVLINNIGE